MAGKTPAVVLVMLWLVGGSACGRGNEATPPKSTSPDQTLSTVPIETADPTQQSPLERALGGPDVIIDARLRATAWKQEDIAECMKSEGWEFTPFTPSRRSIEFDYYVGKWQTLIGDAESRARWGYGIATRFRNDGTTYDSDGALLVETSPEPDPNSAASSDLSLEEQKNRMEALVGSAGAGVAGDVEGCSAQADTAFEKNFPAFAKINLIEDEIGKKTASAKDMADAIDSWFACMRAEGFEVSDPINPGTPMEEDIGKLFSDGKPIAGFEPKLRTLQERELTMAATDWQCRSTTMNPVFAGARTIVEKDLLERASDLVSDVKEQGP